ASQRDGYYVMPEMVINGIKLLNVPQGDTQVQVLGQDGDKQWKNNQQLWWTGAQPGAKLELDASVPKSGKYELHVGLTKARDYGVVQFWLDGRKIGKPVDLYNPDVIPSGPIVLGDFELAQGRHNLTVEIV